MPFENNRRVSQETFSRKIGVHWVTVSAWERGKAKPGIDNLRAISEVTGKPLAFFLTDEDEEDDPVSLDALLRRRIRQIIREEASA